MRSQHTPSSSGSVILTSYERERRNNPQLPPPPNPLRNLERVSYIRKQFEQRRSVLSQRTYDPVDDPYADDIQTKKSQVYATLGEFYTRNANWDSKKRDALKNRQECAQAKIVEEWTFKPVINSKTPRQTHTASSKDPVTLANRWRSRSKAWLTSSTDTLASPRLPRQHSYTEPRLPRQQSYTERYRRRTGRPQPWEDDYNTKENTASSVTVFTPAESTSGAITKPAFAYVKLT